MASFRPAPTTHCTNSEGLVYSALPTSTHVFARKGAYCSLLQPRLNGSFRVISRSPKFYILELHGRQESVSLDRLNPSFLDAPNMPHVYSVPLGLL